MFYQYKKKNQTNLNPTLDQMLINLCGLMSTLKFRTNKELLWLIYTKIFMSQSLLLEHLYFFSIIYSVSLTSLSANEHLYLYLVVLLVLTKILKCTWIVREIGDTTYTCLILTFLQWTLCNSTLTNYYTICILPKQGIVFY